MARRDLLSTGTQHDAERPVLTRMLIFLDLGGRELKSSTATTRHITASQNQVENKPMTLLWHSEVKN